MPHCRRPGILATQIPQTSGCSADGSARRSGRRGRRFKSDQPDQELTPAMKPFLLLQIRPEDHASDGEYEAIAKFGKLSPNDVERVRVDQIGVPEVDFDSYSAILIGGGPWNPGDPEEKKSDLQKSVEAAFKPLLKRVVEQDIPFLGLCYGLEILIKSLDEPISHAYGEKPGAIDLSITKEGMSDHLLTGISNPFRAFVGHKESAERIPHGSVLLVYSADCPVHMFRLKQNVYAVQFHPEMDSDVMCERIDVYKHAGYFPPEDAESLKEKVRKETITEPMKILKNFTKRYRQ